MRVTLISDCLNFALLFNDRSEIEWTQCRNQSEIPVADLYIWDYISVVDLRRMVHGRNDAQHLILTDSKDLALFRDLKPEACLLLKPINSFTLIAFVDLALASWRARTQAKEAETFRLDRNELLKYILGVNIKLQEYDQERSSFVARALHDFRSPLTALHGYCGLLRQEQIGPINNEQRELLHRMEYSTKRLERLANGTLQLLLQGRVDRQPEAREANIALTLKQAIHDVLPLLTRKELSVQTDLAEPEGSLVFDPEQIEQVFVNLLENSCKFTPQKGSIQICGYSVQDIGLASRSGVGLSEDKNQTGGYRIDLRDSGPGVPPHLAERVFEEHASYSGVLDRSAGGLGLAICKGILTAHKGKIWAATENGGRFSFVLPQLEPNATWVDGPVAIGTSASDLVPVA